MGQTVQSERCLLPAVSSLPNQNAAYRGGGGVHRVSSSSGERAFSFDSEANREHVVLGLDLFTYYSARKLLYRSSF